MTTPKLTLVTIADQRYFWGLFLVAASVERWGLGDKLMMFHTGLDRESENHLSQFSRVELREMRKGSPFGLHCRKPEAMLQAEGEYIGWIDSDCLVVGDISDMILPENGEVQARMRTSAETVSDLQRFYQPGEKPGGMPRIIMDQWRKDVGEREVARTDAMVPSNVFVMHSRFKPFIEHWERQMDKVLDPEQGTIDLNMPAYMLTDESVLNSLLAFADFAPEVAPYRLATYPERHLAHFMGSPKPWVRWLPRNLEYLPRILSLMDWLKQKGMAVPPLPPTFDPGRQAISRIEAHVMAKVDRAKKLSHKILKKAGR